MEERRRLGKEETLDRVLKKAQGSMEKGTTAGDAFLEGNSPHWSRTPLMGLWPGRCPRWDRDTLEGPMERTHVGAEEPSSRKKSACTNPNLLHYHCLAQGPEHNLRAREERGRKLSPSLCLSSGHCISPANW